MKLFVEPVDVWMFRDGRPFDAGEHHQASSLFPPYPTVTHGVVRSHHLVVLGVDLGDRGAIRAAVGTAEEYRGLQVRGPFVARREGDRVVRYYPLPADAISADEEAPPAGPADEERLPERVRPLIPSDHRRNGVTVSSPLPLLLWSAGKPRKGEGGGLWLSEPRLLDYLRGEDVVAARSGELFETEIRLGIGLEDAQRTAKEGALYEVRFVRPSAGVGLELEATGLAALERWPEAGPIRMGGEGRGGWYTRSNSGPWPAHLDPLPPRFKLYLATPAFFSQGWRPSNWALFLEGQVELAAAAVRGYEAVSGFDMAAGYPKPSRRFVPAGSVYFFESDGSARLRPELVKGAVTEWGAEIGFGEIMVGRW